MRREKHDKNAPETEAGPEDCRPGMETETLAMAQEADFTVIALFFRATLTVQLVMIALIVASVYVWAITFSKYALYRRARANAQAFDAAFWSGEPLDELYDKVAAAPGSASERVFVAGMTEWRRSLRDDGALIPGVQQRVDRSMDVAIARENERLTNGLNFLATTGATAPFVGPLRHGLGHHAVVSGDRDFGQYLACRRRARYRRGAAGHGSGPSGGHPGGDFLQQAVQRCRQPRGQLRKLRRRVLHPPVAAARLMGASVAKSDGPRRRRGRGSRGTRPMSEINVTPFVDVMLCLLIIFMVAAPLMTVGVPIDLPDTSAEALPSEEEEPLTVTLTPDGAVMVQTTEVPSMSLSRACRPSRRSGSRHASSCAPMGRSPMSA
jgi:biopolymer transport protein ExbD